MPGFGRRGIAYTPFFAQGMENIGQAMGEAQDYRREEEINQLAEAAWMGDPQAIQDLAARDPELAATVEQGSQEREDRETQLAVDKDARFKEDMETAMAQIGTFETYEEAMDFGGRITTSMMDKYPERWQQSGAPTEFTEEAYNEIRTITGGASGGKPIGVAFRSPNPSGKGGAIMMQQVQLPNGRRITEPLKDSEGNVILAAEYDAGLAYEKASAVKQATIDLADEEALAKLSAEAKTAIMPARLSAQETIGMITAIKNHPGLTSVVGMGWLNPVKYVPGTDAHNFQIMAQQAQGKVFEQAYQTLKGGGPITEIESRMASQAIARMDTSQSIEEYTAALNDFETAIRNGYDILLNQASGEFEVDVPLPERLEDAATYTRSNPATPASIEEKNKLPSGAHYLVPGTTDIRVKK